MRHSYASTMVRNGAPLLVLAETLGHSGTRMVEKHYAHFAPNYVAETIRRTAPYLDVTATSVVPLARSAVARVGSEMSRCLAVLSLCGCLAAAPCRAEGVNAAGFGLMSCADAAPVFDQRDYRRAFLAWTLGFATGINNVLIARDRQFRDLSGLNTDLVVGSLRAYCTQHPTALLVQGAESFFEGLPLRAWTRQR